MKTHFYVIAEEAHGRTFYKPYCEAAIALCKLAGVEHVTPKVFAAADASGFNVIVVADAHEFLKWIDTLIGKKEAV